MTTGNMYMYVTFYELLSLVARGGAKDGLVYTVCACAGFCSKQCLK